MTQIDTIEHLERLYGAVGEAARRKVQGHVTPLYAEWIRRSRFCILSTVGPEGTDGSPRGDDGPVVQIPDPKTILMPDWRGNNRVDSLRNIVRDGRVSLMFMVAGSATAVRVNGRAILSVDDAVLDRFARDAARPRSVIAVTVDEVYSQCARAILRADLWSGEDHSDGLPTVGAFLREVSDDFDADAYDADWPGRAAKTMW